MDMSLHIFGVHENLVLILAPLAPFEGPLEGLAYTHGLPTGKISQLARFVGLTGRGGGGAGRF